MAKSLHNLTEAQWSALMEVWSGCAYCGVASGQLQKDCMLPVSRGGRYTLLNVVPARGRCNASKCNTEVTVWMRRKKLDERAFLVRQAEVASAVAREEAAPAHAQGRTVDQSWSPSARIASVVTRTTSSRRAGTGVPRR